VVAADRSAVGFGGMLVNDGRNRQYGNEEFVLNVWDAHVWGETVLWDESHSQFYGVDEFSEFAASGEDGAYDVSATPDLVADLPKADAIVVTSASKAFSDEELDGLVGFVADGGAVFLHDQSDLRDYDSTANLNPIADLLDLDFRFTDDDDVFGPY
jgi:hypothetical protein